MINRIKAFSNIKETGQHEFTLIKSLIPIINQSMEGRGSRVVLEKCKLVNTYKGVVNVS